MDQSAFRSLLHRYQQGSCTPAEKRRVEQWYARLGEQQSLDLTADEEATLVTSVWERIARQTGTARRGPGRRAQAPAARPWSASKSLRWAAGTVLVAGAALVGTYVSGGGRPGRWRPAGANVQVAKTTVRDWQYTNASPYETRIALSDGSAVKLAPASSLRFWRTADGKRRVASLTGAASFDVFHDENHPFSVVTASVVSTVLGTSFRVTAYAGQPEVQVQVMSGAVRVRPRTPRAASVVVRPNQQAVYLAAGQVLRRELVAQPVLLTPGAFEFNDRPVAEVLETLGNAYGVVIAYDAAALRNCTVNLTLRQGSLFAKLDLLCETLGATYDKADGRILFRSPPCPAE